MTKELLQAQLQMCQMLGQIGALQQQVAHLQAEKLNAQLAALADEPKDPA